MYLKFEEKITRDMVSRLQFSKLQEPTLVECIQSGTLLKTIPVRHLRVDLSEVEKSQTMMDGGEVPTICNWVLEVTSNDEMHLHTNTSILSGEVAEHWRREVAIIFDKLSYRGFLTYSDIATLAAVQERHSYKDVQLALTMCKNIGVYHVIYRYGNHGPAQYKTGQVFT